MYFFFQQRKIMNDALNGSGLSPLLIKILQLNSNESCPRSQAARDASYNLTMIWKWLWMVFAGMFISYAVVKAIFDHNSELYLG